MQPPSNYPGAGGPDGTQPPYGAGYPPPSPQGWWPQAYPPPPRKTLSRKAVIAIVVACVLGVAVLGMAIAGAVSVGRAAGQAMSSQAMSSKGMIGQTTAPVQTMAPVDPSGLGHDLTLNAYAARCYDGHMQACDDLYDDSLPMSTYEQYGMTCGGRVKPFDVDYCTELG